MRYQFTLRYPFFLTSIQNDPIWRKCSEGPLVTIHAGSLQTAEDNPCWCLHRPAGKRHQPACSRSVTSTGYILRKPVAPYSIHGRPCGYCGRARVGVAACNPTRTPTGRQKTPTKIKKLRKKRERN